MGRVPGIASNRLYKKAMGLLPLNRPTATLKHMLAEEVEWNMVMVKDGRSKRLRNVGRYLTGIINCTKKGLQAVLETRNPLFCFGGAEGIRTPDLLTAR